MGEWTKEPWEYTEPDSFGGLSGLVRSCGGSDQIAQVPIAGWKPRSIGTANGRRITSCVNALAGLNPDALGEVVEAVEAALEIVPCGDCIIEGCSPRREDNPDCCCPCHEWGDHDASDRLSTALASLKGEK